MKLICDTNIIFDVLLKRDPFYASSVQVLHMIEDGEIDGTVSVTSLKDIFYIVRKISKSKEKAYRALELIRRIMEINGITAEDENRAFGIKAKDYEDSLIAVSGESIGCDYVLTRNVRDYESFDIKPITPEQVLDKFRL